MRAQEAAKEPILKIEDSQAGKSKLRVNKTLTGPEKC